MKKILFVFLSFTSVINAQNKPHQNYSPIPSNYWNTSKTLTQEGAMALLFKANELSDTSNKKIALAILDAAGNLMLLSVGDGVGPHNATAAQRKAFTALSTKTSTLQLSRKAAANPDTINLNSIPELLLLGGGVPIVINNTFLGSIGVAGGGGPEQDHELATQIITILTN
jgi:uncharacterized protein GlcG (DUF336 family)